MKHHHFIPRRKNFSGIVREHFFVFQGELSFYDQRFHDPFSVFEDHDLRKLKTDHESADRKMITCFSLPRRNAPEEITAKSALLQGAGRLHHATQLLLEHAHIDEAIEVSCILIHC